MAEKTAATAQLQRDRIRAILTVSTVSLVALAGYGGFRFAAQIDLGDQAGAGLVALAVITGFAVFFSPCSFPLLIAMLARPASAPNSIKGRRDGLLTALTVGTGAALFLMIAGLLIGLAGEGLAQSVSFSTVPGRILRVAVAAIILTAGLVQLGVVRLPLWRVTRLAGPIDRRRTSIADRHQHTAHLLYGFGFVLAGFG